MQIDWQDIVDVPREAWQVAAQMAPYLLLGFAVAGLVSVWLSPAWIVRHLGGRGVRSSLKAALFGVPLPLCSCGVIPVAAELRRAGASRGATAAFLMSTPQTGIDSFFVTYGLLGPVFALFRPVAAFVSGALCGVAVDALDPSPGAPPEPAATAGAAVDSPRAPWWRRALRHAFVTLPADLHVAVLVGLLVAGLLGALLPPGTLATHLGGGVGSMIALMLFGVPLYVCSTASVPIALMLLNAGVSPGAVLAFLITGPATNAAAVAAFGRVLGWKSTLVYLVCLVATALAAGLFIEQWLQPRMGAAMAACHAESTAWWQHAAGGALLLALLAPWWRRPVRRTSPASPGGRCSCRAAAQRVGSQAG